MDNYEQIFRYDNEDALLVDWVETLVEHQRDNPGVDSSNWEKEIVFIYKDIIGKFPAGVRLVEGKEEMKWACSVDVTVPGETSGHGKNLHLGTYGSIVDAICARKAFVEVYKTKSLGLQELEALADRMREDAKARRYEHVQCPHCGNLIDDVVKDAVSRASACKGEHGRDQAGPSL